MTLAERIAAFLRPTPAVARKAVTGAGVLAMTYDRPLSSSYFADPQSRAAAHLRAYRVGWFYKAEHKISSDFASLEWKVSEGDDDSNESQDSLPLPDLDVPFDTLSPIDQFMRLMERPNPNQTGRQLREKSQIRLDMAGWTFLYLEGGIGGGLPTAIYGISPTRMWPSYTQRGELLGWVMDKDSQNPVPFDKSEIVQIAYQSEADDQYGVGVVEAIEEQVPLTGLMATHTANVLTTGGRLAGMISPKDRTLAEDEYQDVVRSWRSIANDPNAARRLLVFPEPMEWSPGAATPDQIGIPELSTLNRDEILTAFPISPFMLGVPMPGGFNSGEIRREERRAYFEGTIHPRVDVWEEAIKVNILDRYERAVGATFDFDFEEPNLDDAQVLIEKVGAARALINVGFDPEESVKAAGLDHIKFLGVPAQAPILVQPNQSGGLTTVAGDTTPADATAVSQNVVKSRIREARDEVVDPAAVMARAALARFLDEQRDRVIGRLEASAPRKGGRLKSDPDWWDAEKEDAELALTLRPVYADIGQGALEVVANRIERYIAKGFVRHVLDDLYDYGATRIVGINAATKAALSKVIEEGIRRGYSIAQIVDGNAAEGFVGLKDAVLDNGAPVFDELRAETIARTETMLAYNRSALTGYGEFGVATVLAYDGDQDDECAARDGHEFPLDEALGIEDHPNGTLDWAPVLDKSWHEPPEELILRVVKALPAPVAPAPPVIHVHMPASTPDVNVTMPEQVIKVAAAEAPPTIVNVDVAAPEVHPAFTVEAANVQVDAPISVDVPPTIVNIDVPPAMVNVELPAIDIPPTIVNVDGPVVNVPETQVHVDAPVTVEAAKVVVPPTKVTVQPAPVVMPDVQDVRVVDNTLPKRKQKLKRDLLGRIDSIEEE